MPSLLDIIPQGTRVDSHRPWPRIVVTAAAWSRMAAEMAAGRATLLGLWGDDTPVPSVHMAVIEETTAEIAVVSVECQAGKFPSIGAQHPPAIRFERAINSLYGFEPVGARDSRPWLDLGFWDVRHPLGARRKRRPRSLLTRFYRRKAKRCTRFPSARFMQGSSNRDISALPPAARPWCGSKNVWATCTRASSH